MNKRVGFVGVGKWAEKLRAAFVAEGWRVVCHSRKSPHDFSKPTGAPRTEVEERWGFRVEVEQMVEMDDVDLIVCAADPKTTTRAALLAAENCRAVLATKPLLETPKLIGAPFIVDFWRLMAKPWTFLRDTVRSLDITHVEICMHGNGPFREFPGVLDYGPHAMAFLYDLEFGFDVGDWQSTPLTLAGQAGELIGVSGKASRRLHGKPITLELILGNGATNGQRYVVVETTAGMYGYHEPLGGPISFTGPGGAVLKYTQERVLRDIAWRFADPIQHQAWIERGTVVTTRYSEDAQRDLTTLRRKADLPPYGSGD